MREVDIGQKECEMCMKLGLAQFSFKHNAYMCV